MNETIVREAVGECVARCRNSQNPLPEVAYFLNELITKGWPQQDANEVCRLALANVQGLATSGVQVASRDALEGPRRASMMTQAPMIDDARLDERLAFLQLSNHDRQRLQEIAPSLKAGASLFTQEFYRHLFAFPETAQFFQDPQLVERLKKAQEEHLETMLDAHWDADYVARRRRVGNVHAQVGINPDVFLGAYSLYLQYCFRKMTEDHGSELRGAVEQMLSLLKVVLLDIGLTLDAYFFQVTQNLHQALELVFKANAELRQFAQFTSHDLRTPLATVANLCDEVLDEFGGQIPAEAKELLQAAGSRVMRMSGMVDELLQSALSLGAGGETQEFSSKQVIEGAVDMLQPLFREKEIRLSIASDLPTLVGDKARIREVFFNLLSNAVKFSDKQPAHIAIDVEEHEDAYVFSIADDGPGIPENDLVRIFSPFRRSSAHRHQPGTGLGLYFAKTIVEQQGGRIWAESQPGEGSRFNVQLPKRGISEA